MALLLFQGTSKRRNTMTTNTQPTPTDVEAPTYPEMIGEHDGKADSRAFVPDVEDPDPDEAGYGYGV
jgi:hypothetical protein